MEGFSIVLLIVAIIVVFVIQGFLANRFQEIVEMKGYKNYRVWAWVFWLGLVGMLIVIALPDRAAGRMISNATPTPIPRDIADELPEL